MSNPHVDHARTMLAYERWANQRTIESLESIPEASRRGPAFERAMGLVPHTVMARRLWLARIRAEATTPPAEWFPAWPLERTRREAAEVDGLWEAYLAGLADGDLARVCRYSALDGTGYTSLVGDILTHVTNHSTYHRGQVARLVSELGGTRAVTDFIAMTRIPA